MKQEINSKGEIIIYQDSDGAINLDVRLENDTDYTYALKRKSRRDNRWNLEK